MINLNSCKSRSTTELDRVCVQVQTSYGTLTLRAVHLATLPGCLKLLTTLFIKYSQLHTSLKGLIKLSNECRKLADRETSKHC